MRRRRRICFRRSARCRRSLTQALARVERRLLDNVRRRAEARSLPLFAGLRPAVLAGALAVAMVVGGLSFVIDREPDERNVGAHWLGGDGANRSQDARPGDGSLELRSPSCGAQRRTGAGCAERRRARPVREPRVQPATSGRSPAAREHAVVQRPGQGHGRSRWPGALEARFAPRERCTTLQQRRRRKWPVATTAPRSSPPISMRPGRRRAVRSPRAQT